MIPNRIEIDIESANASERFVHAPVGPSGHRGDIRVRTASASPGPQMLALLGRIGRDWWIWQPLVVTAERDTDGRYVVSDDRFLVYGAGATGADALDDYITSLTEYYALVEAGARENPYDCAELQRLSAVIVRTT